METNQLLLASVPRWFTVAVVNIIHGLNHVNARGMSVLYPVLREQFAFGYMGIAVLSLAAQVVSGPMQITFGVLTRLVRRTHILGIGTAIGSFGMAGIAVSQTYGHLVASRMVRGLGLSPQHPVGGAIVVSTFPRDRAKALGLHHTSGNIGSLIAPLVVGILLHLMGWRSVILVLSFPLLFMSFLCYFLKEPLPQVDAEARCRPRGRLGLHEYKAVFRNRNALILALVMMVGAAGRGTGGLHTYLTALLVDRYEIPVSFAALFLSVYAFGGVAGPLAMGWLADRASPRLALRLDLLLSAAFVLLILAPSTPGIALGAFVFLSGFFIHSRGPLIQTLLIRIGPQDTRIDTLLSMYFTMAAITGPVWTLLTGMLVDWVGMGAALGTMAASYVVGMALLSFVRIDHPPT